MKPVPIDQMLILKPIGEYAPGHATADARGGYADPHTRKPQSVAYQLYAVTYTLPDSPGSGPQVGPFVMVNVQEYPNAAWAKYELRDQRFALDLDDMQLPVRFGNRVLEQTDHVYKLGDTCYSWVSQNRFVTLEFSSLEADEFLQEYLIKYPSSL